MPKVTPEAPPIEAQEQWQQPKRKKQNPKAMHRSEKAPPQEGPPSNPKSQEALATSSTSASKNDIPTKNQYEILSEEEDPELEVSHTHHEALESGGVPPAPPIIPQSVP